MPYVAENLSDRLNVQINLDIITKKKCRMRQKLSGAIYENSERLLFKQTDQQKR